MKREVVNKVENDVVRLGEVTRYKFYGVVESPDGESPDGEERGFITCDHEYKWGFVLVSDLMEGLLSPSLLEKGSDSLNDIELFIEALLEDGYKVYEFDSAKELMEWCLEG